MRADVGQSIDAMRSLHKVLQTIRVEHTVFALPFAYATLFLVAGGWPAARTLDHGGHGDRPDGGHGRQPDRRRAGRRANPRTARGAIPAGRLPAPGRSSLPPSPSRCSFSPSTSSIRSAGVCGRSSWRWWWCIRTRSASPDSHLVLGVVYLLVPTSVWIAVTGGVPSAAVVLGVGAALWVAGFDIIYACQDVEVDRREGLHSMPADFGVDARLGSQVAPGVLLSLLLAACCSARELVLVGDALTSLLFI